MLYHNHLDSYAVPYNMIHIAKSYLGPRSQKNWSVTLPFLVIHGCSTYNVTWFSDMHVKTYILRNRKIQ